MSIPDQRGASPLAPSDARTREAARLMEEFAERTGLTSGRAQHRYLWTDAFAVCNFLGLARATGETRYLELSLGLIDRVHDTLGKHRPGDSRVGWLSGLGEAEGGAHPTRGGLRIGKKLPERLPNEPFDERLEWDRDGQYFHYLTRWMHALDQACRATGESRFNAWARELAETSYAAFTYRIAAGDRLRMAWKMSIDLSRPLVLSMGHHDPLDGLITCAELQATAAALPARPAAPALGEEIAGFHAMVTAVGDLGTADPLGIGGLLADAYRVEQLTGRTGVLADDLLRALLSAARDGLRQYADCGEYRRPASRRLAFRELGLSIGLRGVEMMRFEGQEARKSPALLALVEELVPFRPLGSAIEAFWLKPQHQEVATWTEHRDINEVMLATSLLPEGYLKLR